jgi:hypothetical protein
VWWFPRSQVASANQHSGAASPLQEQLLERAAKEVLKERELRARAEVEVVKTRKQVRAKCTNRLTTLLHTVTGSVA